MGNNVKQYFFLFKGIEASENVKKLPLSVTPWGSIFQGVGNVSALNWACLASFWEKLWRVLQCINTLCCFSGCQHGVGHRVSLTEAISDVMS